MTGTDRILGGLQTLAELWLVCVFFAASSAISLGGLTLFGGLFIPSLTTDLALKVAVGAAILVAVVGVVASIPFFVIGLLIGRQP